MSDKCSANLELLFVIISNLSAPVHLYYRPQVKSIHVFKRRIPAKLFVHVGLIVKMKMQVQRIFVKSRSTVVIFTTFESSHTAGTGLPSF